MHEKRSGGGQVSDVHLLPVLQPGRVVGHGLGEDSQYLLLGRRCKGILVIVRILKGLESLEELRKNIVVVRAVANRKSLGI